MKPVIMGFIALLLMAPSAGRAQEATPEPETIQFATYKDRATIRILINSDGKIMAQEAAVSLKRLEELLARLKDQKGSVWYKRLPPETKASLEQADRVIALVIKYKLPICFSEKADYEDCKF